MIFKNPNVFLLRKQEKVKKKFLLSYRRDFLQSVHITTNLLDLRFKGRDRMGERIGTKFDQTAN